MPPSRVPRSRSEDRPPAPWGKFPLTEVVVFVGLILLLAGFFVAPPRGPIMIGAGLVLSSVAGLELALREHLAGYRSHTLILAGMGGVITLALGWTLLAPVISPAVRVVLAAVVFGLGAWYFSGLFARRSGGARFRL